MLKCRAYTLQAKPCKNNAMTNHKYCGTHKNYTGWVPPTQEITKAYLYIRKFTHSGNIKYTVDDQVNKLIDYCEQRKLDMIDLFVDYCDNNVAITDRPELQRLLSVLQEGCIVVCQDIDVLDNNIVNVGKLIFQMKAIKFINANLETDYPFDYDYQYNSYYMLPEIILRCIYLGVTEYCY